MMETVKLVILTLPASLNFYCENKSEKHITEDTANIIKTAR